VSRSGRLRSRVLIAVAAVGAFALAAPSVAGSAGTPLTGAISCTDVNGGLLLPGDSLSCNVTLTGGSDDTTLDSLEVDFPEPGTTWTSGGDTHTTSRADWSGVSVLAGTMKTLPFSVTIDPTTNPGTVLRSSGFFSGTSAGNPISGLLVSASNIMSPFLSGSSLACSDTSGSGKVLPGDTVQCLLQLTNAFPTAYTGLAGSVPVPAATAYASGGSSVVDGSVLFDSTALPDLIPGAGDPPQAFSLTILPSTVSGTSIAPVATITGTYNASPFSVRIATAAPLITDPGPADLTKSTLACHSTSGDFPFAGGQIGCTVTVAPLTGFESVTGANATIQAPAGTSISGSGNAVTLPLGDVPAGNTSSASFQLDVNGAVAPGTPIEVTGSIAATSVPSGVTRTQPVTSAPLTVGVKDPNRADLTVSGAIDSPAGAAAFSGTPPKALVHLKVVLHNAGPSTAAQPVVVVSLPDGVTFEKFDDPSACGRDTLARATCEQPDGTLAAGASYVSGMTLALSPVTPESGRRVIGIDASSQTPDPVLPNTTNATAQVQVPAASRTPPKCRPRSSVLVRIAPPKGGRWRALSVKLGTRKLKVARGRSAWTVRVPVPKGASGRLAIRISGRTTRGQTIRTTRRIAVCGK
jgi:hypothetical protein